MPKVGTPVSTARASSPRVAGSQGQLSSSTGPIAPPSTSSAAYAPRSSGPGSWSPAYGWHTCSESPDAASHSPHQPGPVLASCWTTSTVGALTGRSQRGQVAVQLERGDLTAVVEPLRPLVAQEEVEDVLAEGLGHQLAALH